MVKRLLTFITVVIVLVACIAALLASELLPPTRPEQRAALEFLRQPQPHPEGRSAFAVLWFVGHDLAGRDPEDLLREDVQAYATLSHGGEDFRSVADDLPGIRLLEENLCPGFPEPCLPALRELPDAGAALRSTYQDHLASSEGLVATDHFAYPFPMDGSVRFPRMGRTISLRRFANAQTFVAGNAAGGLADTCREFAAWRRIRPGSDILIQDMVAIAFAQTQAGLFAEMLAEWPVDEPLPEICRQALAPLSAAELDQCRVWRGEAAYMAGVVERGRGQPNEEADVPVPGWVLEIFINRRRVIDLQAPELAAGCKGFRAGPASEPGWMDWIFDPVGSLHWETRPEPGLSGYRVRHLDHLDVIQTVRILAWLRSQPDRDAAWENLPAELGSVPGGLNYDVHGNRLSLAFRHMPEGRPGHWLIPLPPALPTRAPPG